MKSIPAFQIIILLSVQLLGLQIREVHAGLGLRPLDFFRFSDEELGKEIQVVFHPDEGLRLREHFQKKYGVRGEDLIKSLGEGESSADSVRKADYKI